MQWSDIPFDPPRKTLRQFAGLCLGIFGALALYQGLARGRTTLAMVLAGLALTVGPIGLIWPRAVRPVFVGWMVLAFPIGWVISRLMLAFTFYGLITPVALIFRLIGRDVLERRFEPARGSYWTPKVLPDDPRRYFRQF
jgi:hypothetical protein